MVGRNDGTAAASDVLAGASAFAIRATLGCWEDCEFGSLYGVWNVGKRGNVGNVGNDDGFETACKIRWPRGFCATNDPGTACACRYGRAVRSIRDIRSIRDFGGRGVNGSRNVDASGAFRSRSAVHFPECHGRGEPRTQRLEPGGVFDRTGTRRARVARTRRRSCRVVGLSTPDAVVDRTIEARGPSAPYRLRIELRHIQPPIPATRAGAGFDRAERAASRDASGLICQEDAGTKKPLVGASR